MPTNTSKGGNGTASWIRLSHPHLSLRDPCRYTRYQRSSLFARRAQILRAAPLQRFGQMRQARGQELAEWWQATGEWELEVVERPSGTRGFSVVPRRWVVERTFSWISRNRRMSKDYERKVQTSETLIQVAMIRLFCSFSNTRSKAVWPMLLKPQG